MQAPFSYIPALPVSAGLMAGILLYATGFTAWSVAACTAAAAIGLILLKRHYLAVVAVAAVTGWWLACIHAPQQMPRGLDDGRYHTISAVAEKVTVRNGSQRATVKATAAENPGESFRCVLVVPSLEPQILAGNAVDFEATFERAGLPHDVPDEIDYTSFYKVDGSVATAFPRTESIAVTPPGKEQSAASRPWPEILRGHFVSAIVSSPVQPSTAAFLAATLTGDDELLGDELREDFRATGLAHALALSGFHVGVIVALVSLALFPLRAWSRAGRLRHIATIIAVWTFAIMTGASPSVTRAAVMVTVYCVTRLMQRRPSPFNALAVAAIVILAINPYALWSPGFQLSFAAVLSILLFTEKLNPFPAKRKWPHSIAAMFCLPLAAMVGTALISAIYFHRLPLLSVLTNAVAGMLLPLLLGGGVILTITTALGVKFSLLGWLLDLIYRLIESLSATVAGWPFAEVSGVFPSTPVIVTAPVAIAALAIALHYRHRRAWHLFAVAATALACAILLTGEDTPAEEFYICRTRGRTDILVRRGQNARLFTTAAPNEREEALDACRRRYGNWLMRRRATLELAEPTAGRYIVSSGRTFVLVTDTLPDSVASVHADYAIVSRDFRGKIDDIVTAYRPDTLIIARDNSRRRDSLFRLTQTPTISLRERPFSLVTH